MREVIEYGDSEVLVITHLNAHLATAKAGLLRDTSSPAEFVRVSRTGGTIINLAQDQPILTFECWGGNVDAAAALASETRRLVQALYDDVIDGCGLSWFREASGPVWFPHPDTDAPRYQHSQQITVNVR